MTKLVYGIGIVGEGQYKPSTKGVKAKSYTSWSGILRLVKDGKATICEDWLNYQNYAAWYELQRKEEDWKLSNSFLTKDNHYSENTCVFVPNDVQQQFSLRKNDRGDIPVGVRVNKGKYGVRLSIDGKLKSFGSYDTIEEAFSEYKTLKENHVKSLANKYKESLSEKAYAGLLRWEVDIND